MFDMEVDDFKTKMDVVRYERPSDEIVVDPIVFLAGPTVRGNQPHLTSWRFAAIAEFAKQNFNGTLIVPEFTSRTESDKGVLWIPLWEFEWLKRATCIMFWIPRTWELIGLTTNFEIGYWLAKCPEKVVYGRPDEAYRIQYVDIMWQADTGNMPICNTLEDTVKMAIERAARITARSGN